MNNMTKKILVAVLTLIASLLVTSNVFAQQCTHGVNFRFLGVGSSAQINELAYGASKLLTSAHGTYALISFGGSTITDKRAGKSDTGITTWVEWDPTATTSPCDAYAYFQTDSAVGDKDFFAYETFTASASTVTSAQHFKSIAGAYATVPSGVIAKGNKIPGLPDNSTDPNGLPATIQTQLNLTPEAYVNQPDPPAAQSYCGNVATVAKTSQIYCYFNAAGTDIRPEDALYATTRALTPYDGLSYPKTKVSTGNLTGLGYGVSPGCTGGTALVGCGIEDAFNQGAVFNVASFKLAGTDPISGGTIPGYTTLAIGAAPAVVIVGNSDTSTFGFGHTVTDSAGNLNYTFNDINRQVLAQTFSGSTHCTGDLLAPSAAAGLGAGQPMQVIEREPLSGTYNTFEFTAVRTEAGSANPYVTPGPPISQADSGQEQYNDPISLPSNTGSTTCPIVAGTNYPSGNCFNPMFLNFGGSKCPGVAGGTSPGLPVRLRTIGSGMEVKAVVHGLNTSNSGSTTVFNPIGYAFWAYGNLDPLCSSINSNGTCGGTWLGHYLTVDGIDPLFATEGGEFDDGYGNPSNPSPRNVPYNPSGVNNPPVCSLTGSTTNCFPIPFTHLKDGKYPLWTVLRTATFAPKTNVLVTPPGVLDMIANEEITAVTDGLSPFVPFLTNITGSNGVYKGDLNLFVYRSHYKQSGIAAGNGHKACAGVFTGVSLQGGNFSAPTCLVDFGGDVGGSVLTVQSDVDFLDDFSLEEFGVRQ